MERFLAPLGMTKKKGLSCPSGFKLSCELAQEAYIVLKIELQIIDVVFELRQALNAQAESEAGITIRVVVYETVHGGIDHASAEQFDPARLLAHVAALAAAEHARRVHFHGRVGERKIAGSQARFYFRPEEFAHEIFDRALEIAKGDVRVDGQAFDLVKHETVRRVGIIASIHFSGHDDAYGRLLLFHRAHLHGRSVRAQQER